MRRIAGVAAAVALLALVGCGRAHEVSEPNVIATPNIVETQAATSPLESDPHVQAIRAYLLGYVLAVNFQDFTIEQYTSTRTPEQVFSGYERFMAGEDLFAGPRILAPLSVTPTNTGGAVVEVCRTAKHYDMDSSTGEPRPPQLRDTIQDTYFVEPSPDGGQLVVTPSEILGSSSGCSLDEASIGTFDPLPKQLDHDDVVKPIGYDEQTAE